MTLGEALRFVMPILVYNLDRPNTEKWKMAVKTINGAYYKFANKQWAKRNNRGFPPRATLLKRAQYLYNHWTK